jgi:serine/threonine-protein kinase
MKERRPPRSAEPVRPDEASDAEVTIRLDAAVLARELEGAQAGASEAPVEPSAPSVPAHTRSAEVAGDPSWAPPEAPDAPGAIGRSVASITEGMLLNGIYAVGRRIAAGGMGEVYEGINVNTDERVAIKVILPHLAADPKVREMFRREARTLTSIRHAAVAQYRVLAQEPSLGLLYIVTEFIDGIPLSEVIARGRPPPMRQLIALTRRLASGLEAAHALGAVHRDLSPDNVLLPGGKLDQATIIDFGIAKDLESAAGTVLGHGFAGKLAYVAPEQFGEFDRDVGPWTDVYSLGLTVLATARGRESDLGGSVARAIDKRRSPLDVGDIAAPLGPLLARMLERDPSKRLRSMRAVVAALEARPARAARAAKSAAPAEPSAADPPLIASTVMSRRRPAALGLPRWLPQKEPARTYAVAGGLAAVLMLFGVAGWAAMPRPQPTAGPSAGQTLRKAMLASVTATPCNWVNIPPAGAGESGLDVRVTGVARDLEAARRVMADAARDLSSKSSPTFDLKPAGPVLCAVLDAARPLRAPVDSPARLAVAESRYAVRPAQRGCTHPGPQAKASLSWRLSRKDADFALVHLTADGTMRQVLPSRAAFDEVARTRPDIASTDDEGVHRYALCTWRRGLQAVMLVEGEGPFVIAPPGAPEAPDAAWPGRFAARAAAGGWRTQMAWFEVEAPAGRGRRR